MVIEKRVGDPPANERVGCQLKRILAFVAAATMGALALTGCGGSSSSKDLTLEELTGAWVLESGKAASGELKPADGIPIELNVASDGAFGANAGCNDFAGTFSLEDGKLSTGPMVSTLKACDEALMGLDQLYAEALEAVDHGSIDGEKLTLEGPDTKLVYTGE